LKRPNLCVVGMPRVEETEKCLKCCLKYFKFMKNNSKNPKQKKKKRKFASQHLTIKLLIKKQIVNRKPYRQLE
jgi:hypothetical protein